MRNPAMNLISMYSTKMKANNRVMAAILSVLVLSSCVGMALGVGTTLLGSNAIPLGDKNTSFYDFGKGEITLFQHGCFLRGTWKNNSDKIQRNVRVDLQAIDKNGNTLGVGKLTFLSTLPDETSDSRGQGIVWKTGSIIDFHCPGIAGVFAKAYLVN